MTMVTDTKTPRTSEKVADAVIRFAGDSGDGMQLTGTQFTSTSAMFGNDLATLPDYPAEIRAPAGTIAGVSAFQVRIADHDVHTPGDAPDVLVAMNPAALVKNIMDLKDNGIVIVNVDEFVPRNYKKAEIESDPLEDAGMEKFRLFRAPLTSMTREALKEWDIPVKLKDRCKNFFALGMCYWLYSRDMAPSIEWLKEKFAKKPEIAEANIAALTAGWNYCNITGAFQTRYEVMPATLPEGTYRNINGNHAVAVGFVAASRLAGLPLFLGSYPITPASDILHYLADYKNYGVTTFQAEDEIAAVCAAIGASYGGALGITTTSGPGLALKSEAINLAMMVELPLVVVNVQRGGPSTGLPTKTEQADLLQVMYGRNGESPIPVVAIATPGDAFEGVLSACRVALESMTPVILLSDGYIANGAEPWKLPVIEELQPIEVTFADNPETFEPYKRDPETLARMWAIPGTPGLEHRVGGLEKDDGSGHVSYDPVNHEVMVRTREEKVRRIADRLPNLEVDGDEEGDLLIVGWGSTEGAIKGGVAMAREEGYRVSRIHIRWINPFPNNLGEILSRFKKVVVPEMNGGQLTHLLRAKYLKDVTCYSKVQGKPFYRHEILTKIAELLEDE